jgi:hypothetical protein
MYYSEFQLQVQINFCQACAVQTREQAVRARDPATRNAYLRLVKYWDDRVDRLTIILKMFSE